MSNFSISQQAGEVVAIARHAGDAIMRIYKAYQAGSAGDDLIQSKADQSPLTQADLTSHHVICNGLTLLTPDIPVVSEEDEQSESFRQSSHTFWLIDPLDGTKEFIACNDEFTVNIALVENGLATWGVVHAPALGQTYWGGSAHGSLREDSSGQTSLRVANQLSTASSCRVVASKSHLNTETADFIAQLGDVELVQAGSSLKFCKVAEAAADIYPRLAPTCEWDTAAAQAVLEGAGGYVVDTSGQRLHYGKADKLNPFFVAAAYSISHLLSR